MYTSVPLQGGPAPGVSSGEALDDDGEARQGDAAGRHGTQWTELAFQERATGITAGFIFALSVLFVFLVLAAQYESWSLPLAIILIVPMSVLSALVGVMLRGHGQQHPDPDRPRGAGRPRGQERHPDRRVRPRRRGSRRQGTRSRP